MTKDQLRTIFTEFRMRVELETGLKVKILRCDNGGEYKGLEGLFGITYGIQFEYTTAYTPWQNGVPERLNRTLVSVSRAMLADAGLPPELWGEAVIAASYIRNRTPIGPGGITPEEAYSGKKPSVAHLRAWGCVAYAHLAPEQRNGDKLSPNAVRTALVGYMPTSKQYRLYDPERKRIIISTSPRFEEGRRLLFPHSIAPLTETVGFDPMEADPLHGPVLDLNAQDEPQPPSSSRTRLTASSRRGQNGPSHIEEGKTDTDRSSGAEASLPLNPHERAHTPLSPTRSATDDRGHSDDRRHEGYRQGGDDNEAPGQDERLSESSENDGTVSRGAAASRSLSPDTASDASSHQDENGASSDDAEPGNQLLQEAVAQEEAADLPSTLRRSGRERRPAQRFEGAYAAVIHDIPTPLNYAAAMAAPGYAADWALAIQEEITKLQALRTWEFTKLPAGKRTVGTRWVFKVKYTITGLIDRFKARLVAQGFSQTPGDDFLETFSPTIRAESLRFLLAIGTAEDLEMRQVDVVSAYPHSKLHAEVYLRPPPGLNCPEGMVLRARKSIPGLKQSGREWYIEACKGFKELGLGPLFSDPSIFSNPERTLIIGLYVDDMLILSESSAIIDKAIASIRKRWEVKDLGNVSHILGLRVIRDRKRRLLSIDQIGYIDQMVRRFGLADAKPCPTPAADRLALIKGDGSEALTDQRQYQEAVGCSNWVTICTRFDIAYVSTQLSQHCSAPTVRHWNGVTHLIRYMSGTRHLRLYFGGSGGVPPLLQGYCDADYAGDHTDRRSVTGHLFMLNKGLVSWTSAKQRCVATSTTEAEYIALCEAAKQGQWLRTLLKELGRHRLLDKSQAVQIFSDNQSCIAIAEDPIAHRRTKHIDVRYHYIRQLISAGKTRVSYIPTDHMKADVLTKPLPFPAFQRCIRDFLMPPSK